MLDSNAHFNGLIELIRAHLYTRLKSEKPERLASYKIETSTLENYRRIHSLLRSICVLIFKGDAAIQKHAENGPTGTDEQPA